MKICTICKVEKPLEEFNKKKARPDGLQPHCRDCSKARFKVYYTKNHKKQLATVMERTARVIKEIYAWLETIKRQGCCLCDEKSPCTMDFHHIDSSTKLKAVSVLVKNASYKKLVEEMNKCVLICSNCHRKVHAGELKIKKSMRLNVKAPK